METKQTKALDSIVDELRTSAGDSLLSVVLHGAEVRGDHYRAAHDLYLLVVLADLEPETLQRLRHPVARWLKKGHPMPRFFTPATIADSADAFSIELLDIKGHNRVLHGTDHFGEVAVDTEHLRLQCERELREKLMRVQEAYVEARGRNSEMKRLLIDSYLAFLEIFRGCLRLLKADVPARAGDVLASFCEKAELDPAPFAAVDELARGDSSGADLEELFVGYYQQIIKAVDVVDRLEGQDS